MPRRRSGSVGAVPPAGGFVWPHLYVHFTNLIARYKVDLFSSISNSHKVEDLVVVQCISNEDTILHVYKMLQWIQDAAQAGTGAGNGNGMCRYAFILESERRSHAGQTAMKISAIGLQSVFCSLALLREIIYLPAC